MEMLVEYGSDPRFPRARASEYSTERWQSYLLSSEWVQELPCRYGRHIRIVNSKGVNASFDQVETIRRFGIEPISDLLQFRSAIPSSYLLTVYI